MGDPGNRRGRRCWRWPLSRTSRSFSRFADFNQYWGGGIRESSLNLMLRFIAIPGVLGLLAVSAQAQVASFQSALAGFFYSPVSRTVSPLLGVPGATYIGSPLLSNVDLASVAPGGRLAFVTKSGHAAIIQGLSDGTPVETPVDALIPAIDRVIWSPSGQFAASGWDYRWPPSFARRWYTGGWENWDPTATRTYGRPACTCWRRPSNSESCSG